jgi:hypothetical protein
LGFLEVNCGIERLPERHHRAGDGLLKTGADVKIIDFALAIYFSTAV